MFTPNPYFCFDVKRNNDRCVCGASALITSPKGINRGYCKECTKKRATFVEQIVGDIYIGNKKSYSYSILSTIENLRKSILQERFNYMIDCFFGKHQNDEKFQEPYENDKFIEKLYREKHLMMEIFISSISSNKKIYNYYRNELNKMAERDYKSLEEAMIKQGCHIYTKSQL